jgi:hypothetical protein
MQVFKIGPRRDRAAQDRRAGNDVRETPADAHDFEALVMLRNSVAGPLRPLSSRAQHIVEGDETARANESAVAPDRGIDEAFREPLGLRPGCTKIATPETTPHRLRMKARFAMKRKPRAI